MNHPDLQQFAKQLAIWTEQVIENGRTPFRRVDLYPSIQTEQGVLQPPLIFWINRQSMMAGGILLIPEADLPTELQRGRYCAEALGLRHFATWEIDRIRIWQLDDKIANQHQEFLFGDVEHPDSFRQQLEELLEALKLLAVIGLIPASQLSPHYLHNLFQTTLEHSLPPLLNNFRSQRAQEPETVPGNAERLAIETNRQLLLQLLSLLWYQQLPSAILPEKLVRAIELSLPKLPESLQRALCWHAIDRAAALPHESTVCYHHLLLRLQQLAWNQPPERALLALRSLIADWFPPLSQHIPAQICFYPATPQLPQETSHVLSDSPSLLAALGLLEQLDQQLARQQYFGNLLQFTPETLPQGSIQATLICKRVPGRDERHQYAATLRTSWPNRRFKLAGSTPLWLWETVHLLGLHNQPNVLHLTLPETTLTLGVENSFWILLLENYQICSISKSKEQTLQLQLIRGSESLSTIQISTSTGQFEIAPADKLHLLRSQILLALQLPTPLSQLCSEQLIACGEEQLSKSALAGLKIYAESSLGQLLWQQLCNSAQPETEEELFDLAASIGWPHPEAELLEELTLAAESGQKPILSVNEQLAGLLQSSEILAIKPPFEREKKLPSGEEKLPGKILRQQLIQQLQTEGVPSFPEKYLYFLESPQMVHYQFTPPLNIQNDFLGQCELLDAAGQVIQVYGDELVQALLLCSELNKNEVELPSDRQQVALLLDQYREDLIVFQRHLNDLCFRRVENSKAARKLAKKTWAELELPPLKWLDAKP